MDLTKLEAALWERVREATDAKDHQRVMYYTGLASKFAAIKGQLVEIEKAVDGPMSLQNGGGGQNADSVTWEVTEGAMNQSYLLSSKAAKAGLIDRNSQYEIATSTGQKFTSGITNNMFSARAETKKFYQRAEVTPGSVLKLEKRGANKLYLSKIASEANKALEGW